MTSPAGAPHGTDVVGRRIVAFVIDLVVYVAASVVAFRALGPTALPAGDQGCTPLDPGTSGARFCFSWGDTQYLLESGRATTFLLLLGGIWLAYHGIVQALVGTLGKRLLGLAVVDLAGNAAGPVRTVARSVTLAVGASFFFIGFLFAAAIGMILIAATPRHQRTGDFIAKTLVVRASGDGPTPEGEGPTPGT